MAIMGPELQKMWDKSWAAHVGSDETWPSSEQLEAVISSVKSKIGNREVVLVVEGVEKVVDAESGVTLLVGRVTAKTSVELRNQRRKIQ